VRRERRNLTDIGFPLHDTPNDLRAETCAPDFSCLVDRAKEGAGSDSGCLHPGVNSSFYPIRDWNGSYVAALADKIGYDQCSSPSAVCLPRVTQSVPPGGARTPAESPVWHSRACLEGLRRPPSATGACPVPGTPPNRLAPFTRRMPAAESPSSGRASRPRSSSSSIP